MKRLLLSGILLLSTAFCGQAQEMMKPRYASDVSLTAMPGLGQFGKAMVGLLETCHGMQWDNKVFAGLGTGFSYSFLTEDVLIPVFAEGRYHWYGGTAISPFVSFRLGGLFCTGRISNSWTVNPSMGIKVKRFSLSAGYEFLISADKDYRPVGMGSYDWVTTIGTTHGITFRIAYSLF